MEAIANAFRRTFNLMATIGAADVIDILIVAYLIYKAIRFVRKTNSYNLAKGIIVVLVVFLVSDLLSLTMINFILRKAVELGLIALLILFQPELRRILERMGSRFTSSRKVTGTVFESAIAQIVMACRDMSASRTGALMIFERNVSLDNIMTTGTVVNADVTAELIKNLFYNKAPLHDGAVIMRDARIAAAGCVLPLTQSTNLSKELGMRHRAGIGLSEQSDAVVVIVSEETGSISVAVEGMLKRHLTTAMLDKILHKELVQDEDELNKKQNWIETVKNFFKVNKDEEEKSDEENI